MIYINENDIPFILTVEQVQELLQIGENKTYELFNDKVFPVIKIGRQMRVTKNAFLKWLEEIQEVAS